VAITGRLTVFLGVLGVAAVGFLFWRLYRHFSSSARSPAGGQDLTVVPGELRAILRSIESRWARAGWPRPAIKGLREHLDGLPADALPPEVRDLSSRVLSVYYRARFGAQAPTEEELGDLRARPPVRGGPS
jgi:hypothetical protein